jgi:hypothetical protein
MFLAERISIQAKEELQMHKQGTGRCRRLGLSLVLVALAAGAGVAAPREVDVLWRGDAFASDELPADLSEGAVRSIASWTEFARDHGYRMLLAADEHSLLLVSVRHKRVKDEARLIEETSRRVRELIPVPARETAERAPGEWRDDAVLCAETAVVVRLRDPEDYVAVLQEVGAANKYLGQPWIDASQHTNGFILQRPLCSAFLERASGVDEWDVDNELVHRLSQLLVLRDFGQQPFWLTMGMAWNLEYDLREGIYCFPYRDGFVWASEHGSWLPSLRNGHRKREELAMEDLSSWYRGSYDDERARRAWGAVRFLAEHRPTALPKILEDLRLLRDDQGIEHRADGSWSRRTDWTAGAADQLEIFRRHAGDDFLEELLRYFQLGKRYRPKR